MSEPERRGRATLGLLIVTVLLPLAVLGLGFWERQRSAAEVEEAEIQRARTAKAVAVLEARPAPANGRPDFGAQFRRNGHTFAGPIALSEAREELEQHERWLAVAGARTWLPPAVILCGGLTAALSVLALAAAAALGRAGRRSREALVSGFSAVRRALPALLGTQVVLGAAGTVAAVAFETTALLGAGLLSSGGGKLLGIAVVAIGVSLWTAARAVMQLRRAVDLFAPDPLPILGRPVTPEEAPGLWRLLDGLAARLGALRPDNVVVGLTGGFFVASGPKVLDPGDGALDGRTLYLPLPYLPLLREDEVATIIGHELAHFSGGDTEYSLRFLPIYVGVGRSLDAVAEAGALGDGSTSVLIRPTLRLGEFVMDQFHHAVRHWSRQREFAADAAGAEVTSADAGARALLRTAAAHLRIEETLGDAFREPGTAPPDLVTAVLERAAAQGLDDPAAHLEERQPHPTDTHPPTRQRLEALGREPDAAMLAEAAAPPPPEAAERLSRLFADPAALCRAATADFVAAAQAEARAGHAALEAAAGGVAEEPLVLHENVRAGSIFLFAIGGALLAILGVVLVLAPRLDTSEQLILSGVFGGLALVFLVCGLVTLRRGRSPFLTLRPGGMEVAGLDRAIAWEHVADLDMTVDRGRVTTRVLLPPGTAVPARAKGARRVSLDAGRRIVAFTAAPPTGMDVQGFADLIARYRRADAARRILAEEAGRGGGTPAPMPGM